MRRHKGARNRRAVTAAQIHVATAALGGDGAKPPPLHLPAPSSPMCHSFHPAVATTPVAVRRARTDAASRPNCDETLQCAHARPQATSG